MKIYVGNLSYETTEEDLRTEFGKYGKVDSVSIVTDRSTGQPRGFAFVEMPSVPEGQAAISGLNGKTIQERTLVVNAARPPENRGGFERRGSGNRGGYGGNRFRSGGGGRRY